MAALNGFVKILLCSNYIPNAFGARNDFPFPCLSSWSLDVSANFIVKLEIN